MGKSHIEWTDMVWNPAVGCDPVSAGCARCYAATFAKRLRAMGRPEYQDVVNDRGHWTGKINLLPERLEDPLRWKKPRRVFVNSMSDLFHPAVPFEFIKQVWGVMALAYQHIFMILTKRPERMYGFTKWMAGEDDISTAEWPHNVWLGVSVENQQAADERIPLLLKTPAAIRFLSVEPMLGPVDLTRISVGNGDSGDCLNHKIERIWDEPLGVKPWGKIDWVICGGESGPSARPMHPDWARSIRDQCQAAGVPFFFKQWGGWVPNYTPIVVGTYNGAGIFLKHDGTFGTQGDYWNSKAVPMDKVGKLAAGSLLDGREWKEFPAPAAGGGEGVVDADS